MSHAARALTHRTLRHRHLMGLILIATLVVWSSVWFVASYRLNHTLDALIAAARTKGITIQFENRTTYGSPLDVDVQLNGFSLQTKDGPSIKADTAMFYLDLWNWSSIAGKLRDNVQGVAAGTPFTAGSMKFGFDLPARKPHDHSETGLAFWVQPFAMTLKTNKPLSFGNSFDEGLFKLRIMGPVPDFLNKNSIAAWNNESGVIEFDRFYLVWGPMTITANGTVALDEKLQPQGAFSGRIDGLDIALTTLIEQNVISERDGALAESSLHIIARPSGLTGTSSPIVPVSVQDGGVYLGPVRVLTLPQLVW